MKVAGHVLTYTQDKKKQKRGLVSTEKEEQEEANDRPTDDCKNKKNF
jgi:hypothetical protein